MFAEERERERLGLWLTMQSFFFLAIVPRCRSLLVSPARCVAAASPSSAMSTPAASPKYDQLLDSAENIQTFEWETGRRGLCEGQVQRSSILGPEPRQGTVT